MYIPYNHYTTHGPDMDDVVRNIARHLPSIGWEADSEVSIPKVLRLLALALLTKLLGVDQYSTLKRLGRDSKFPSVLEEHREHYLESLSVYFEYRQEIPEAYRVDVHNAVTAVMEQRPSWKIHHVGMCVILSVSAGMDQRVIGPMTAILQTFSDLAQAKTMGYFQESTFLSELTNTYLQVCTKDIERIDNDELVDFPLVQQLVEQLKLLTDDVWLPLQHFICHYVYTTSPLSQTEGRIYIARARCFANARGMQRIMHYGMTISRDCVDSDEL